MEIDKAGTRGREEEEGRQLERERERDGNWREREREGRKEESFWRRKFPQTRSKKVTGWRPLSTNEIRIPRRMFSRNEEVYFINCSNKNIFFTHCT